MTILEKVRKREKERMAKSESGYIMYEDPLTKLLSAAPNAYNRVIEAVYRVIGRRNGFIENRVALDVIYNKVNVSSNAALDNAVKAAIANN